MRSAGATLLIAAGLAVGSGARAAAPAAAKPATEKRDAQHGPSAAGSGAGSDDDRPANACRRLPAGKRIVRLNLKPDTTVVDLIGWISSITCMPFIVPSGIGAENKKVTIVSPTLITPEEAYRLFLGALDSVGLTVYPTGKFQRVIEAPKAKTAPVPFCVLDEDSSQCAR